MKSRSSESHLFRCLESLRTLEGGSARPGSVRFARRRLEGRAASIDGPSARRELDSLQRSELAELLRAAARIRAEESASAQLHPGVPRPECPSAWRARCDRSLRRIDSQAAELAAARRLLDHLRANPVANWPSPRELARRSLELERTEQGRIQEARSLLTEGDVEEASKLLRGVLRSAPSRHLEWWVLEGLAWAAELAGRLRAAHSLYGAATRRPRCPGVVFASYLYAARATGRMDETRRALEAFRRRFERFPRERELLRRCLAAPRRVGPGD